MIMNMVMILAWRWWRSLVPVASVRTLYGRIPSCARVSNYRFCVTSGASAYLLTCYVNINILYMVLSSLFVCVCMCLSSARDKDIHVDDLSLWCLVMSTLLSLYVVCQLVCHPKCEPEVSDVSLSICTCHAVAMLTGHSGMYRPRKYDTRQSSSNHHPHSGNIRSMHIIHLLYCLLWP